MLSLPLCLGGALWGHVATAQEAAAPPPADVWRRSNLLGDLGGVRTSLAGDGITFGLQETSEVLGNVSGGIRRGADYDGLTLMSVGLDTAKAFGWQGGTFNASAEQIHGRDLSTDNLDSLQTASGIEADRATRLWELWYQQAVLEGRLDVKLGQQSADQEFMVSQYAGLFVNTMFGWPALPSYDLPSGGPAYPLSALGVRVRAMPTDQITVLAAVFNGDPVGNSGNMSGTAFRLRDGVFAIAEVQYALNQPSIGEMDDGTKPLGLPGTYKLGAWYHSQRFADPRFDNTGLSLANPASDGIPLTHLRDYSIYAVADQAVWQPDPAGAQLLGVFARLMGAPDDRNLIDFSLNAGLSLKAPLPGRDADTAGLAIGFAKLGSHVTGYDGDIGTFTGTNYPRRTSETFLEVTYQAQLAPWWTVQPDFQYTFNPGGGILNPNNPGKKIGDEAVFGLRTVIVF
jgi:porin